MDGNQKKNDPKSNDESEAQDIPKKSGHHDFQGARVRSRDSSGDDASSDNSLDSDLKRSKAEAKCSSPDTNPVANSPPKFVSLEEIIRAANGVSNMILAHEIAVDKNFKIENPEPEENSLLKQVKDIVHKAFWDVLEEQLSMDPPEFTQGLSLLREVKEGLLSLLLPQHTHLRAEINEVLDVDLIKQKTDNGVLDFHYYSQYVMSVMAKLCAPARDEKIRELMAINDVIPLFREIMQLLEVLKLDMANFTIQQIRPHIQQHSIEYEKEKFKEFLKTQNDGLEFTKIWLKSSFEKVKKNSKPDIAISNSQMINSAYMELLYWDSEYAYPETLILDHKRFVDCDKKFAEIVISASVLLITYDTVGGCIQGITPFKQKLRQVISTLVEGVDISSEEKLLDLLKNLSLQVMKEVNECLNTHNFPQLTPDKEDLLQRQIQQLSSSNNIIKKLIKSRCHDFIEQVLSSVTASPIKMPPGLSSFQSSLANLTGQFLRLVSHNRAVFGDYYADIISKFREDEVKTVVNPA
ncbi:T-complex protein 11-like protein 1 [Nymphon striatum]|nr:T-complex protein 11-like protein 1 [Nymphon striatum]